MVPEENCIDFMFVSLQSFRIRYFHLELAKIISQFENIFKRILLVADLQEISMKPEKEYYNLDAKLKLTEISQKSLIQHASFLERCKMFKI